MVRRKLSFKKEPQREPKHAPRDEVDLPSKRRAVTIFGGGVAGLTAAHELIERGFRVEVWEPKSDERVGARGCAVGGMARTQWSAVEWPEEFSDAPYVACMPEEEADEAEENKSAAERRRRHLEVLRWWDGIRAEPISTIEQEFYVQTNTAPEASEPPRVRCSDDLTLLPLTAVLAEAVAKKFRESLLPSPPTSNAEGNPAPQPRASVYAECLFLPAKDSDVARRQREAVELTKALLVAAGIAVRSPAAADPPEGAAGGAAPDRLEASAGGTTTVINVRAFECPPNEPLPADTNVLVRFRRRERWLPGEHGYRFFPSFYSHLFDTMRRTPILKAIPKSALNTGQELAEYLSAGKQGLVPDAYTYSESGLTVYDNLISAEVHALAFDDDRAPLAFPRYRPGSLTVVLQQWRTAMERFDFAPRDLARYVLRIQEFAMMSPERRAELSNLSWWEFVGGNERDYYTRPFKEKIERWTEGLVAMSCNDCDAHTYGAILLQIISDQYRSEKDYRDGILNGPTSDAWLDPWRRYLEAQGVRFIHGELAGFDIRQGKLWPLVNCFEPRYPGALEGNPQLLDGYFIMALPVDQAKPIAARVIADSAYDTVRGDETDFEALAQLDLGKPAEARPGGMLRHFAGLQFYFPEDIPWVQGHIYYPDAPWGLSSISQLRYWQQKRDWEHGYRGVMSVIIGAWDVRSPVTKRTAWESAPEELAAEVWRQLRAGLQGPNDPRLGDIDSDEMVEVPSPIYWRLDDGLDYHDGKFTNATPFVMTQAKTWNTRPGRLPLLTPEEDGRQGRGAPEAYAVFGNVVLAGTYMKTFTRLTTMESANESARHAVNAILTDPARPKTQRPSKLCKIFPLEHREPADLGIIKDIDAKLNEIERALGIEGPRSLVSTLGLDRWTAFVPKRRSP